METVSRRKLIIISSIVGIIILGLIAYAIYIGIQKSGQNQFGSFIKIQNYNDKIKNVSNDVKDSIQSSLYNTVKSNLNDDTDPAKVDDAFIRDGSDTQSYDTNTQVYSGNFIVDMASIKQSYEVQYSYSTTNTIDTGGSPVVISCLDADQLKYGAFKCTDLSSTQTSSNDTILQYLPYSNFTFKISPDSTSGSLVLLVDLTVSDQDLAGDAASRTQVIAMYKDEVNNWIKSKGLDPTQYTYKYNYSDDGTFLGNNLPS